MLRPRSCSRQDTLQARPRPYAAQQTARNASLVRGVGYAKNTVLWLNEEPSGHCTHTYECDGNAAIHQKEARGITQANGVLGKTPLVAEEMGR